MCGEVCFQLRRYKTEMVISPAGETLAVTKSEVGHYGDSSCAVRDAQVCLRCSSVKFEAKAPASNGEYSKYSESVASFLTRTARVDRPLGVDEVRSAIEWMHADIERLRKLLPQEPYR